MISVLVVDDSAVVRRVVADALSADLLIQVAGTASNGQIALEKIERLAPDLVTLDVEMPVMDGLATLRELRRRWPRLPVIMFSTMTEAGAAATLTALSTGASDYVTKPSNAAGFDAARRSVREQLLPRIHALCAPRPAAAPIPAPTAAPARHRTDLLDAVAVGCSTGGPEALSRLVDSLPAGLAAPVLVVQHMPALFTRLFAERLGRLGGRTVVEADDAQPVRPGTVYIAPGGRHFEVVRRNRTVLTRLHDGPPENFCRPAVDVLFRSVAGVYGRSALGVVLTGMGRDGRDGCHALRAAGGEIVVQDEASSVVWGMPGAVASAGLADAVLTVPGIADHVARRAAAGQPDRTVAVSR